MTRSTRFISLQISFIVILLSSGCAHTDRGNNNPAKPLQADNDAYMPQLFLLVSDDVKNHFRYDNKVKPSWPPRVDMLGNAIGNCMTYSRIIRDRLEALGYSVRYRNVLAPVSPRAHVVAIATDHNGADWVFDNRYAQPYPSKNLAHYYEIESFSQSAQVGAQRHQWIAINRTSTIH